MHKAIAHGFGGDFGWRIDGKGKDIAARLGIDYQNQYKNYKKREFEPQRFPACDLLYQVAQEEARKVGFGRLTPEMYAILTMG